MPLFALCLLLQLMGIVHVMRTGRERYWVMIILMVPLLGSLAYFIVELLPDFLTSHKGQKFRHTVSKTVNPKRQLNELLARVEQSPTLQNKQNLAEYYISQDEYLLAARLIEPLVQGLYDNDAALNKLLIRAHFGLEQYSKTLDLIEAYDKTALKQDDTLQLIYARTLLAIGQTDKGIAHLSQLFRLSNQTEIGYWYLKSLTEIKAFNEANQVKNQLMTRYKTSYCTTNQYWLKKVKRLSIAH